MKKIIYAITIFFTMSFGLSAYTLRESIQESLSKRGVKQSIIDETVNFWLDSKGEMSIIPQQDEINNLISKAETLLKKDKNNTVLMKYLVFLYLKSKENKNLLKAKKVNEENWKEKNANDFENWSTNGLYYYQIGEKKKAQEYFDKIKEKYKDRPAVYNLIEIMIMDIDILSNNKNFNEFMTDTMTNEKKMREIKELAKKQAEKVKNIRNFFQSEENKREFGIVDEVVFSYDLALHISKINEIIEENSKNSDGLDVESIKKITNYYLKNIANGEKMTEDAIKYNIIPENIYLNMMSLLASNDEKESTVFSNKLEKSKLYEIMRKLEE